MLCCAHHVQCFVLDLSDISFVLLAYSDALTVISSISGFLWTRLVFVMSLWLGFIYNKHPTGERDMKLEKLLYSCDAATSHAEYEVC